MKYAAPNSLRFLMFGLAFALLPSTRALSQNVTGINIIRQATNAVDPSKTDLTTLFSNGALLQDAVNAAWRGAKPAADKAVENAIGDNNSTLPKGVTIYNQHSSLATDGTVTASIDNAAHVINLKFTLLNNYIEFKSTVPSVAHVDPKLSLNYDMDITAAISIPGATAPLNVQSAVIAIRNANLDSHNVPGDLLLDVSAISRFFGGPNFKAGIENKINRQVDYTGAINRALAPVNQQLQQLAQQGYTRLTSQLDQRTRRLMLQTSPPSITVYLKVQGDATVFLQNDAKMPLSQAVQANSGAIFLPPSDTINTQTYPCMMLADVTTLPIRILIDGRTSTKLPPGSAKPPVKKPGADDPHPGDGDIPRAGPKGSTVLTPNYIRFVSSALELQYNIKTHRLTGSLINGKGGDMQQGTTNGGAVNGAMNQSITINGVTLMITEER